MAINSVWQQPPGSECYRKKKPKRVQSAVAVSLVTMPLSLAFILSFLFFVNLPNNGGNAEWHDGAGPWVNATKGEIWPLPYERTVYEKFYHLQASNFTFEVLGEKCDILTDAVRRYTSIIQKLSKLAKIEFSNTTENRSLRDNANYQGSLRALKINLKQKCEELPHLWMDESYTLEISKAKETGVLTSDSIWGILRGIESFSQLITTSGGTLKVECQYINDKPKLPHRGLLLDTSRHFLPVSDILQVLDGMAYNKLNVFHWHIVDDNSFPYESARFPALSAKGAYHPSMVYIADDMAKIIEYARFRGIRVLPEFDTPGHTKSWGLAYPQLLTQCYDITTKMPNGLLGPIDPTRWEVYTFMEELLSEVVGRFPDNYIHLGGDEVLFTCWASNPRINEYMQNKSMSNDYSKLEEEYIRKILNITKKLNVNPIVWQEVFDNGVNIQNGTIIHVWLGDYKEKLSKITSAGYSALLSECWYLDHLKSGGDWLQFYQCDPLNFPGTDEEKKRMLGGEACMWGEFVDRTNVHSRIWPRASAAAERLWSEKVQDTHFVSRRLEEHACRMNRRGIHAQPPNGSGFCVH